MNIEDIGIVRIVAIAIIVIWAWMVGSIIYKDYQYDHCPMYETTAIVKYRWDGYDQDDVVRKQMLTYTVRTDGKVENIKVNLSRLQGSTEDGQYTLYGSIDGYDSDGKFVKNIKYIKKEILIAPGLKPTDIRFDSTINRLR